MPKMDGSGIIRSAIKSSFIWFTFIIFVQYTVAKETEVKAHAGTNVTLPCQVDTEQCGTLHSVKWYRDTSRIYVFSQAGKIARAEGDATQRMTVEYSQSGVEALLKISSVEVEDEATYKCEITYLEVRENCDVVQIVKLVTLVKPVSVEIRSDDGQVMTNSSVLGPKNEGTQVEVTCEASGGKPIPAVSWYNGTNLIKRATYSARGDSNGVGTGESKLHLTLSRGDLNSRFECRVESEALDVPIVSWVTADVHLRPTRMNLTSSARRPVIQDTTVQLACDVEGARPAATVRWYNGSHPITDETLLETVPVDNRDGTFTTKSMLTFKATRWENGRSFNCYGENEVTKSFLEPAMHKLIILDVRFPPVIRVQTAKSVVNETDKVMLSCTYYANPQRLLAARWLKDGKNFTYIKDKHNNGNTDSPSLHIANINRDDMGRYTCWLQNAVGSAESEDSIFLNVQFVPSVEVIMEPSTPVKATDNTTVTLVCNITSGNPAKLRKVKWYMDGEDLIELPYCNYSSYDENGLPESNGGKFCNLDPELLVLEPVSENFTGNYSCQGENIAGFGPESESQELIVYYPPSPAKLRFYPSTVIKQGLVTLECSVDKPGRPDNLTYIWFRGPHQVHNSSNSSWSMKASLETRNNFTCIVANEGGLSVPDTVSIEVLAPPLLISTVVPYKGVVFSSENVSLTCRVECYPLCSISWYKDNHELNTINNPLYYVNVTQYPADYNKNDFESVESTLVWNITNWPGKQLNKSAPNSCYTCISKSRTPGQPVNYTTEISVDFPPEDVKVSTRIVNVIENEIPKSVKCTGKGRPTVNYLWKKDSSSEPLSKTENLQLDRMSRSGTGQYICEAFNKYGNEKAYVFFNVQFKPDCSITVTERDGNRALVCTAHANPQEVSFRWSIRESNDSAIDPSETIQEGLKNYLILDTSVDTYRTYQCIANNSVGFSGICERKVEGILPWYKNWDQKLILIVAAIITLIICVLIICIVIIILCRRKRASTKSPSSPSSTGDKMRLGAVPPVGGFADPSINDPDKGFYENLPFHGMQNPPNKTNGTTATASDTYIF